MVSLGLVGSVRVGEKFEKHLLCCELVSKYSLYKFRPQPTRNESTYSVPEVTVPARLLAVVGKALDVVKTVATHAKHL